MKAGSTQDRLIAIAIAAVTMLVVWWAWRHLPHPERYGGAVVGVATALAIGGMFSAKRRGQRLWPRAAIVAAVALGVQGALHVATATGVIS